ncbi:MAG: amidohydrolase [Candidatus Moranbacteria bacterium]|nr:amidohydrolase [Candidatus Moranbacteria bacterium]
MKLDFPLINTHTHAAMVGFRGLAEDMPLQKWLEEYIWPAERANVKPDFVYEKTKEAILEMRRNGVEAFSDMYFFEDQVARAAEELGMHVLIGEGILDFPTPSAKNADEAFDLTEKLFEKYKESRFVKVAVAPHSIYTVSRENLVRAKELARKHDAPYHIHLAETKKEFDDSMDKNRMTPTAYLDSLGVLDEKTIAAHCVWLTDDDIDILAKRNVKVSHCPLSNLKLGSGIAPVAKMMEKGICVSLGTDGAASSNRLDIWEAGKFAALLQKGINHDPTVIPARTAIEMMSVNGMEALGFEEIAGKSKEKILEWLERFDDKSALYNMNASEIFD